MVNELTLNIKIKQSVIGKIALKAGWFWRVLNKLGLINVESLRNLLIKTYKYKIGKGKWIKPQILDTKGL